MRVLVVGGGGREHALAWKLAQSPRADVVFVAPGNAGTERERKVENVAIRADDVDRLCRFALQDSIDLTVIGPEAPLVAGVVDAFNEAGLLCLGPSKLAARLEGSKAFAKHFMARHRIPTAAYEVCTDSASAARYLETQRYPLVIKADGLAGGKGVVIAGDRAEAAATLSDMLSGGGFGAAGRTVVIEEFLDGEEASFICLADGTAVVPFASSQDHKTRDDGDRGPNTGGMGAYSPAPIVDAAVFERIMAQVIRPTLAGMAADGVPYRGFLYAGLMIGKHGSIKVLEFNCRFGDPETQPILMRLRSDFLELCLAAAQGRLRETPLEWDPRPAVAVVMAARGYPGSYASGAPIAGLDGDAGAAVKVFHAGTLRQDGRIVSNGGRVLCVCALGESVRAAGQLAYQRAAQIHWDGAFYRRDIGHRALARET